MTNHQDLEQLRRQILAVLDGIERQMNISPRTSEIRKMYKEGLLDSKAKPS